MNTRGQQAAPEEESLDLIADYCITRELVWHINGTLFLQWMTQIR